MVKAPQNIPYYYNRASVDERRRLDQTLQHFGVMASCRLLCEALLRLGHYVQDSEVCELPQDEPGKALFKMYKYYDSLSFTAT